MSFNQWFYALVAIVMLSFVLGFSRRNTMAIERIQVDMERMKMLDSLALELTLQQVSKNYKVSETPIPSSRKAEVSISKQNFPTKSSFRKKHVDSVILE